MFEDPKAKIIKKWEKTLKKKELINLFTFYLKFKKKEKKNLIIIFNLINSFYFYNLIINR